jgi:hypothetical protein
VLPPYVVINGCGSADGCSGALRWRGAGERAMNAMRIVINGERVQLPPQVNRVPKE